MSSYHIKNLEEYFKVYRKSIREPELFWEEIAEEHFSWYKKWNKVLDWDFKKPEVKWFDEAKLNILKIVLIDIFELEEIKRRLYLSRTIPPKTLYTLPISNCMSK